MTENDCDEPTVIGCSVRGPKHEEKEIPCQDSWSGGCLGGDSAVVVVVGDGLGSAERSHIGSQVATSTTANVIQSSLSDNPEMGPGGMEELLRNATSEARSAIHEVATHIDASPSEFNTTLLTMVATSSGVAVGAIGDGGIVGRYQGSYKALVPQEDTEYANVTIPLLSESWEEEFRFAYHEEVNSVAVFSDGLSPWAWKGRNQPDPEFFDQLIDHIQSKEDQESLQEDLCEFLDHDHHRKYSGDDKTLVIGDIVALNDSESNSQSTQTEPSSEQNQPG
ncbi:protein phosphatase 2C domain-containing protein [Haloarcula sp. Atlit-120R]|uniref:protein phosphatase 2C domain-containing protein n=1 Tax=Haloarcula sp. Atlit-120R TaxID=2282135 RepID=UPI000EF19D10|nr:protein phosphatase 2C domain-containing protein [Haloarcula sp. Atlit-120R]RLM32883.1 hypothetical protein DVK01_19540 [Haloarcula sp. Atlit-120R]